MDRRPLMSLECEPPPPTSGSPRTGAGPGPGFAASWSTARPRRSAAAWSWPRPRPRPTRTTTPAPTGAGSARLPTDVRGRQRTAPGDGVIVWHNDRLHRNTRELEDFIDIVEATGIAVATSGDYDLTTTTEEGHGPDRLRPCPPRVPGQESPDRAPGAPGHPGGHTVRRRHRAYGYHPRHHEVVPSEAAVIKEAAVVKEAARRVLVGESLRSVTRDPNERGVPTVSGRPWTSTVLRRMLTSGRISGQRERLGEIVATGDLPAVITPSETARLRSILLDPDRRTNRLARRYPLTGLVYCGRCGRPTCRPAPRRRASTATSAPKDQGSRAAGGRPSWPSRSSSSSPRPSSTSSTW